MVTRWVPVTGVVISAFLSILCAASSSSVPPIVTAVSANLTVTSPAPVSFNCTVDSYPPSNITWLHNGAEVQAAPPRVTISTVQVDNRTQESTLTLLNTTSEDIGTYTCSAVNSVGSGNRTTELQVLGELALLHHALVLFTFHPYFPLLGCSRGSHFGFPETHSDLFRGCLWCTDVYGHWSPCPNHLLVLGWSAFER